MVRLSITNLYNLLFHVLTIKQTIENRFPRKYGYQYMYVSHMIRATVYDILRIEGNFGGVNSGKFKTKTYLANLSISPSKRFYQEKLC